MHERDDWGMINRVAAFLPHFARFLVKIRSLHLNPFPPDARQLNMQIVFSERIARSSYFKPPTQQVGTDKQLRRRPYSAQVPPVAGF